MKTLVQDSKSITAALLVLSLGGLLMTMSGCNDSTARSTSTPARNVRTARVVSANLAPAIRAGGVLTGKAESKLSFKIGGIVDRIFVSESQRVRQGQLLATLNLAEINAQVNQAQNGLDKAQRDLQRAQNLYQDSVATLEQVQNATTGYEVAKSGLEIASFNKRHASIHAPADGRILKRFAEENELISPGMPVLMMSSAGKGWVVKAGLSDREVVRIARGDSASVAFDAYPNYAFFAVVSEISGVAAPMTGTFEVELAVEQLAGINFMSGIIGKVEIAPSQKSRVWLVPIESLIEADGTRGSIYTISPAGIAKKVSVAIAFLDDQRVAISSGLENIDAVVTDGAAYLDEGANVKIVVP